MTSITIEDIAWIYVMTDLFKDTELLTLVLLAYLEEFVNEVPEHHRYRKFRIGRLTDRECKQYFRFNKCDLKELHKCLGLQRYYRCRQGTVYSSFEGLCILLKRLSYPNRLCDLTPVFGRPKAELSMIVNHFLGVIFRKHNNRLRCVDQTWLDHERFAEAVWNKGAPADNIWGFIDGTICYICRPSKGQKSVYSGHKRRHGLKFQSVMCPNGLMAHFYGPFEARRHDSALYRASKLDDLIRNIRDANGAHLAIYGDAAYARQPHLQTPFKGINLRDYQKEYNTQFSTLRISVEWGFAKLNNIFSFVDYASNLKVFLQPVTRYYLVAALFTNAHTCCYGSQVSEYFGVRPPTLQEYFR